MQLCKQCFLLSFMPKLACRSWICLQILFSSFFFFFFFWLLGELRKTFEILKTENLAFFLSSVNMGFNWSVNSKTLLFLQITENTFLTSPEFFSIWLHKTMFKIFEILSFRPLAILCRKFLLYHCSLGRNQKLNEFTIVAWGENKDWIIWKASDRIAKTSEVRL